MGGKLVGQLASNLFASGNRPHQQQNYYGGQSASQQNSGGLAGAVMGGVANMFGGSHAGNQVYFSRTSSRTLPVYEKSEAY